MIKQVPSPAKIATMVLFALSCFSLTLFLWVSFGGPVPLQSQGYRIHVDFQQAVQLADQADVRISGVTVGKVEKVTPYQGRTDALIQLDRKYAPLPSDARATLRLKTLLGETFVELTPGTKGVKPIPEGGYMAKAHVDDIVQLDQVIKIFDAPTRTALQTWLVQQASALKGRGGDINEAIGTLPIFFADTNNVLGVFARQEQDTRRLISKSADVFEAFDRRPGQLRELIIYADRLLQVTARRNQQFAQAFRDAPGFLNAAKAAVKHFTPFAADTGAFIDRSTDIANEFSPTIRTASRVTGNAADLIRHLNGTLSQADSNLPIINKFLVLSEPVFSQLDPFLRNLNPWLQFIGLYQREITSFIANDAAATQGATKQVSNTTDQNAVLHVLRGLINVTPQMLAYSGQRYEGNRANAYPVPGNFDSLLNGLNLFDAAQCAGIAIPSLDSNVGDYTAAGLGANATQSANFLALVKQYVYAGSDTAPIPAPACNQQPALNWQGASTAYPHVNANTSP